MQVNCFNVSLGCLFSNFPPLQHEHTTELEHEQHMDLRWKLFDLFNAPVWYAASGDCTHFSYISVLYEEAFLRLNQPVLPHSNGHSG
jgi:hypothetical protein